MIRQAIDMLRNGFTENMFYESLRDKHISLKAKRTASMDSALDWGWVAAMPVYLSWKAYGAPVESRDFDLAEVFTETESVERIDVRVIDGIAASCSDLNKYADLDEFALATRREHTQTPVQIIRHLAPHIGHLQKSLNCKIHTFRKVAGDSRLFFLNCDFSHRIAALRYAAKQLRKSIWVRGTLRTQGVSALGLDRLSERVAMMSIAHNDFNMLRVLVNSRDAPMYYLQAPSYCIAGGPPPIDAVIVMMPLDHKVSAKIAQRMIDAGTCDVIKHLSQYAS